MATNVRMDMSVYDQQAAISACARGHHRPRRITIGGSGPLMRTTCRDCGCTLARTGATRRWFYAGLLA